MDGTHILPSVSSRDEEAQEDELLRLADELSEREGIPIEAAWDIVCRHLTIRTEAAR